MVTVASLLQTIAVTKGKRAQGRPAQADAEATKASIVSAARKLVRTEKPARISREDIAKAASVDPGLVRYYFGDKNAVFTEVIRKIGDDLHARLDNLQTTADPLDQLRAHVRIWVQAFLDDPHFHELVVDRVFQGEGSAAEEILERFVERAFPRMERLLAAAMKQGLIRKTDPRLFYLAFIGMCEFFATAAPLAERLLGREVAKAAPAYATFIADLLIHGLKIRKVD